MQDSDVGLEASRDRRRVGMVDLLCSIKGSVVTIYKYKVDGKVQKAGKESHLIKDCTRDPECLSCKGT